MNDIITEQQMRVILKEWRGLEFLPPNFNLEWEEARRYPELFENRDEWLSQAKQGHIERINCDMDLNNTDMCEGDLDQLDRDKVKRVLHSMKRGQIELPIFLKFGSFYELVSGNTRLTAMRKFGVPAKAWVIDMDKEPMSNLS